jgi:hypothetical protein
MRDAYKDLVTKERDHLEDRGVNGRIFEKVEWKCVDWMHQPRDRNSEINIQFE